MLMRTYCVHVLLASWPQWRAPLDLTDRLQPWGDVQVVGVFPFYNKEWRVPPRIQLSSNTTW